MYLLIFGLLFSVGLYGMETESEWCGKRTGYSLKELCALANQADIAPIITSDIAGRYTLDVEQVDIPYGTFKYDLGGKTTQMQMVKPQESALRGLISFLENDILTYNLGLFLTCKGHIPQLCALNADGSQVSLLCNNNVLYTFATNVQLSVPIFTHLMHSISETEIHNPHNIPVTCMNYNQSNDLIALGFQDGVVQIVDTSNPKNPTYILGRHCLIDFGKSPIVTLHFDDTAITIQNEQGAYKKCHLKPLRERLEELKGLDHYQKLLLCGIYQQYAKHEPCALSPRARVLFASLPKKIKQLVLDLYIVPVSFDE